MGIEPYWKSGKRKLAIYHGDCLKILPKLDKKFDTIITDPPYGLSFMGKAWDHDVPGVPFWEAALEVAKPGATLMAFGGTRTFHRLACAIEDAGWEIRDCIMWVYGCLSDDTEILVDGKWEPYHKAIEGRRALCYNPDDDSYQWSPIQELLTYAYDETAYRIESESTDQIVSRNHRCLVQQDDGKFGFQFAEEAARQHEICVPILEDLQGLLQEIRDIQSVAGVAEQDMFAQMRSGRDARAEKAQADGTAKNDADDLPPVSQENVEAEFMAAQKQVGVLQQVLPRPACYGTNSDGEQVRPNRNEISGIGTQGGQKPRVEGRGNLLSQARQLQADQVRSLSDRILGDGTERRLRDGASSCCGEDSESPLAALRGSASRRPRPTEQRSEKPDVVCVESGPQAVRGTGRTVADLARITPIHYRGTVWCVRVPTGAFVCRRNGKVFVTGNSGFPKSLDISKAIDKAAGAEREVIGPPRYTRGKPTQKYSETRKVSYDCDPQPVTIATTDAAKLWEGYGTALKPSFEPILVCMKPLDGTFAENAQKHGVAGFWIDGCRIPTSDSLGGGGEKAETAGQFTNEGWRRPWMDDPEKSEAFAAKVRANVQLAESLGRFPANLILSYPEDAYELRDDVTPEQLRNLAEWMDANA